MMQLLTGFLIHGPTNGVSLFTRVVLNGKSELDPPRLLKRLTPKLLDSRAVLLKEYGHGSVPPDGVGYTINTGPGLAFSIEFHQPRVKDKEFRALFHSAVKDAVERLKQGVTV